ncbi:MAG TPA: amidohydrolase family protein [Dehalococcoidia bacterium]|nr:amidohydrolase family protein [Dehalococcoidia bacterium]
MTSPEPGSNEWLGLLKEEIVDPERPIVDPHHHLWERRSSTYLLDELLEDAGTGHNVVKTVFVECGSGYWKDGPEHLRPVGETEFVRVIAVESRNGPGPVISGIVSHADLRLGGAVAEVLDAHEEAGDGLFRGIRHAGSRAERPEALRIVGRAPAGLYADQGFRDGVKFLGTRGLTYETWHYHYQNREFLDLVRAAPDTTIILDHFGTPLGVGPYASHRAEIFEQWKKDIADIADYPNVYAKLGGLAMPDIGHGWDTRPFPPTSDEFVEAFAPFYLHTIECFGPERCMFESNFPVDRWSISYHVIWNGMKKVVSSFSESEKTAMCRGTAESVYRI